jgi:processing peptidase subunit alpha
MYTRLYTQVLNTYSFVESMEAFISMNDDGGMLGIDAACPPEYASHVLRIIIDQLVKLAVEPVTSEELSRAKNMCKSMMFMQLESRVVLCEDIARQYVAFGHRKDPEDICRQVDGVTKEDLLRVAKEMLKAEPSVGCVGHDLSHVPQYDDINAFVKMYIRESVNAQSSSGSGSGNSRRR